MNDYNISSTGNGSGSYLGISSNYPQVYESEYMGVRALQDMSRMDLVRQIKVLMLDKEHLENKMAELRFEILDNLEKHEKYKNKIKKERQRMSSQVAIFDPSTGKSADNDQRSQMLNYLKENKDFLRIACGYTDKKVEDMKVSEMKEIVSKESKDVTVGGFEQWAKAGIKKEAAVGMLFRKIGDIFSNIRL